MLAAPATVMIAMARLRIAAMTLGPVAGADLGVIFAVSDVADVVQRLDLPVAADRLMVIRTLALLTGFRGAKRGANDHLAGHPDPAGTSPEVMIRARATAYR
jgi:hypothetical protein